MNGALLVHKTPGISSFGVIQALQKQMMSQFGLKKKDLPKLGHGGTLDPFATGLLVVLVGQGVKLARYFLHSDKGYEGRIRFGVSTASGDPTSPLSESSDVIPESILLLREKAHEMSQNPYLQIPPMHSAKKREGKRLYELARKGLEIERKPQTCTLYDFDIESYSPPYATFKVKCSSGTYIRTLVQDFAQNLSTLGLLESLHRTQSGQFHIQDAWTLEQIQDQIKIGTPWNELPCWIPFDLLLGGYSRAHATRDETLLLAQGQQQILRQVLARSSPSYSRDTFNERVAIYCTDILIGIAKREKLEWEIERMFVTPTSMAPSTSVAPF